MKVLIVGASPELFWDKRFVPDLVICADGGLQNARKLGLLPDFCIGDNDSGGGLALGADDSSVTSVLLPTQKDESDLQVCVRHGVELGATEVCLLGCSGGRLDHFMGNLGLLEYLSTQDVDGVLLGDHNELRVYRKPLCFSPPHMYRYFSLIPLDFTCEGVCLEGAKYPLQGATLYRSGTRGLSNEPVCETAEVRISVGRGTMLIARTNDR